MSNPSAPQPPHWIYAGSSITGPGYRAGLVTNVARGLTAPEFGVHLEVGDLVRIQSVGHDRSAGVELMQRFCSACAAYASFQRRERWLAAGYAVIG